MSETREIRTDYLARVEGEGAMTVRLADGTVEHVELRIFEPPRFFEAMLRGRSFREAPDITARICGICPVAYQVSALNAMEDVCRVEIPEPIRQLRRLLYCGEWIESHTLHVYMLHAPDFLGYDGAVELARDAPAIVERGLALKKTGNELMALVGGREIHPVNVRVGGFYKAPSRRALRALRDPLERALARSALFRPGGNARAWLFAIMHNVFVNQVRSAAARRMVRLDEESFEAAGHDLAPDGLAVRDIERALGLLPSEQREVVLLIALEALSYADTARVIGVPVGTVMSRLSRARRAFRAQFTAESQTLVYARCGTR